jgi:hypothetical protein
MVITKETVKDGIENGIIYPDGHQIVASDFYEGFDVEHLVETHKSDFSNPKSVIFDSAGNAMEESCGVYNLVFLYWVADEAGVSYRDSFGRGTQARLIVDALVRWSGANPDACR